MSKPRRRKSGKPFIQLYRSVKRSKAYHGLSLPARCVLIELIDRYNGSNNGTVGLSVRMVADELKCSQATAQRAMQELDNSKLAWPMKVGAWRGRRATEWRIAFFRCDVSGDVPVTMWPPREVHVGSAKSKSEVHQESTEGSPGKRKRAPRFTGKAQEPQNAYSKRPLRFTTKAHIESNHTHSVNGANTQASASVDKQEVATIGGDVPRHISHAADDDIGEIPAFPDRRKARAE